MAATSRDNKTVSKGQGSRSQDYEKRHHGCALYMRQLCRATRCTVLMLKCCYCSPVQVADDCHRPRPPPPLVISQWQHFVSEPFPLIDEHLSYGVCLEVRGEIIRTVLCHIVCTSIRQLCTIISTLRWAVLTVLWIWFCHTGCISLSIA